MQSHHILFWSSRLRLSTLGPRSPPGPAAGCHSQGKKKKNPHPSLHLSARDSIAERTTGALLPFITSLAPPAPEDGAPGGTRHHPAYFFFFFLFKLSLLTASVDIISTHANDEDRGGGGIWIHPSSSSSSLIIFFSLGAEGVVCPAETQ